MYRCVHVCGSQESMSVSSLAFSPELFALLNLELTDLASLAGQQAPGILLLSPSPAVPIPSCPHPPHWDSRLHQLFTWMLEIWTQVFIYCPNHLPNPSIWIYMHTAFCSTMSPHLNLFYYSVIPRESIDLTCFRLTCSTRNIFLHEHSVNKETTELCLSHGNIHWCFPSYLGFSLPCLHTWLNTASDLSAWRTH